VRWVQRFGDAGDETASWVAATAEGPLITGDFSSPFALTASLLASAGATDAFVASLTAAGAPRWLRRFGGAGEDAADAIVASADTVRVAGSFAGTIDPGGRLVTSAGDLDAMVVALRPDGALAGGVRFGGAARDEARALGLALDGTAYVAEAFVGRADFGAMSLAAAGGGDGFVQLLDRVVLA
jgi:hypothetical protein